MSHRLPLNTSKRMLFKKLLFLIRTLDFNKIRGRFQDVVPAQISVLQISALYAPSQPEFNDFLTFLTSVARFPQGPLSRLSLPLSNPKKSAALTF